MVPLNIDIHIIMIPNLLFFSDNKMTNVEPRDSKLIKNFKILVQDHQIVMQYVQRKLI